jgi:hypothetical protein
MATRTAPRTVEEYLAALPEDRRQALEAVRAEINRRLPEGYEEGIQYGMIWWHVPHRIFPTGYHCNPKEPLPFAGLASQKGHMALHLMFVYGHEDLRKWFEQAWKRTGKRLDMGKACVRFRSVDDLALDVVGDAVARVPVPKYVAAYEAMLGTSRGAKKAAEKKSVKKSGKTKAAPAKKAAAGAGRKRPARA